ncbi:MAG: Ig-like domain-containing protein [Candidatus Sumerlaeaceae bacterium]
MFSRKLSLFSTLMCLASGVLAQTTSGPEYRGMWTSRFEWPRTTQSATQTNIDTIMTNVRNANFNSVFFQIRGAMETLYPSPNEPWGSQFSYTDPGYDPVAYAVNSAHTAGLEFHAYINTHCIFQATSTSGPPPPHSPAGQPEHPFWLHGNPADPGRDDWCYVDSTGTTQPLGAGEDRYVWAAPGVPSFQTWTRDQILHVANTYDVDGVHFDRIRVAGTGSYDPISRARQASPITNPAGLTFQNWQRDQITRFLNDTYGAVAELNANRSPGKRHIKVSSAPFSLVSSQLGVNQDLNAWTKIGAQDFFCPQVYTSSLSTFASRLATNLPNANGRYIVAGMSRNTAGSAAIIFNQVTEARNQNTSGSLVFSYTGFTGSELSSYPANVFGTFVSPPDMPWISSPTDCIIVGNVTDGSGNPIVDAQLTRADNSAYTWLSGYDGFYSMLKVPVGQPLQITVSKAGFSNKTVAVPAPGAGSVTRINIVLTNSAGTISLDKNVYTLTDAVNIAVSDSDLAGLGSINVTLSSTSELAPEIVSLNEIGGSGRFQGSVQLAAGTATNDGVLQVSDSDTITATYVDEDDGNGVVQVQTASASIDGSAPVITNVEVVNISGTGATVTFSTDGPTTAIVRVGPSCDGLTSTAVSNGATASHSVLVANLNPLTQYYFTVTAGDAAGNTATESNNSNCYSFTTIEAVVPQFFTEQFDFSRLFDLSNLTLTLTPDGSTNFYRGCLESATAYPTDPAGGTNVAGMTDDSSALVNLVSAKTFPFFGTSYSNFYVGSNGYITLGSSDTAYNPSITQHFTRKRIAALFRDFNPASGGTISTRQLADRMAITYSNVPEYGTFNSNNFQIELFFDGVIRITWLGMSARDGISGISSGAGTPPDFIMSDLGALNACGDLQVSPVAGVTYTGTPGGPFTPSCATYTLTNASSSALDFDISATQTWLLPSIATGTLQPDETTTVTVCLDADALAAGNYSGDVIFTDITNVRTVNRAATLMVLPLPDQVSNPSPTDGATDISISPTLTWLGGANTDSFDFYFGSANPPEFVSSLPVSETNVEAGELEFSTTYFWRVDAVNGTGVTTGELWSFTTQPPPQITVTPASITVYSDPGASTSTLFQVANTAPDAAGTLSFALSASDDLGGAAVTEDVGSFIDYENLSTAYYGNVYQVDQSTVLTTFEPYLYLSVDISLNYVVFESETQAGPYNRIFSQTVAQTANSVELQYYPLSGMNVPLVAGRFYIIAVGWNGSGAYSLHAPASPPQSVSFGQQFSGFRSTTYPLGTSTALSASTNTYAQRLTTNNSWISLSQPLSLLAPGESTNCQLNANATLLGLGTYTGNVVIISNDSDDPITTVPVTLIVKDITPPAMPPQPDMTTESDTGVSGTDDLTADSQPDFTGLAEEGSVVTVYIDGFAVGTVNVDDAGAWGFTPDIPLEDGQHSIAVTATDAGDNVSPLSATLNFVIDTTAPNAPSPPLLTPGSDSGVSTSDGNTNINQPTFAGSADANVQVQLKLQSVLLGTTSSDDVGQWALPSNIVLVDSTYSFTAVAIDLAGNTSPVSGSSNVTIDTAAPSVTFSRFGSPVDTIQLHFSETVFNLTLANLVLMRNGSSLSLADTVLAGSGQEYSLSNLAPLTGIGGSFVFQVTGPTDRAGNTLPLTTDSWNGNTFSDLRVSMVAAPGTSATIGQTITYIIGVQNDGPADASNVVLLDQFTTNSLFTTATVTQGSLVVSDGLLQVNLGNMPANSSAFVTLNLIGTEIGALVHQVAVGPTASDQDLTNNAASNSIQVLLGPGADLLGSGVLLSSRCKPNPAGFTCVEKLRLLLLNRGNFDSGKTSISYYLSFDTRYDASDTLLTGKKLGKIKAGALVSKARSLKLMLSGSPSGQYLIVRIDPGNLVNEASEYNNEIVIGPLP